MDFAEQQDAAYARLGAFARNRRAFYETLPLRRLLGKDVVMFAARGVRTADEFVEDAFHAVESSSEETVMGNTWQAIVASISDDTLDAGDLMCVRDGTLWCCELKSQENTVNSSSFPQELRQLKDKVEEQRHISRPTRLPVRAAFCVLRTRWPLDSKETYTSGPYDRANRDLDGFTYRRLYGSAFWQWLVGTDGPEGLVTDTTRIDTEDVAEARAACLARLKDEMAQALDTRSLPRTIDGVLELKRQGL